MQADRLQYIITKLMDEMPYIYYIDRQGDNIVVSVRDDATRHLVYDRIYSSCNNVEKIYLRRLLTIEVIQVSKIDLDNLSSDQVNKKSGCCELL